MVIIKIELLTIIILTFHYNHKYQILFFQRDAVRTEKMTNFEEYYLPINFHVLQFTIRRNFCSAVHNNAPTRNRLQSHRLFARARCEQTMLARRLFVKDLQGEYSLFLSFYSFFFLSYYVESDLHASSGSIIQIANADDVISLLTSCAIIHVSLL